MLQVKKYNSLSYSKANNEPTWFVTDRWMYTTRAKTASLHKLFENPTVFLRDIDLIWNIIIGDLASKCDLDLSWL